MCKLSRASLVETEDVIAKGRTSRLQVERPTSGIHRRRSLAPEGWISRCPNASSSGYRVQRRGPSLVLPPLPAIVERSGGTDVAML